MNVVFAVMPFADAGRPAMGIGLLAAEVQAAGYSARVLHFNLDLAAAMGLADYQRVASGFLPNMLLGEWFFADDVFGADIPGAEEYLADIFVPVAGEDRALIATLEGARRNRSRFLDACVAEIMSLQPRVVGLATVFHQTCACLALARRLKALPSPPVVVMGGANCEGDMGQQLLESFSWIDFVCSGEADVSFPALLDRLWGRAPDTPIPGVLERGRPARPAPPVRDMDALPYPDFDGYFGRLAASPLAGQFPGHLVFETSRGCWWGAKHHCTFCGLNGDTMAFRAKNPDRAFAEIEHLTARYGARRLGCVDNILDMKYVTTLFPRLVEAGLDLDLFYEVKANLRREQLVQLRAGGVTQIQPGIESFSDAVLRLMDKGCTGFQNIQLLRWCRELGIEVAWNVLAGFPGERAEDYAEITALVPRLVHLDPPSSCGMVRLDRFSPFHTRAEAFGFRRVRPARAYFYVFPLGRRELARLAYFFDYDYADGRDPRAYVAPLQREVAAWSVAHGDGPKAAPRLDATFDGGRLVIEDTRPAAAAPRHVLEGLPARVYARCDVAAAVPALTRALDVGEDAVEGILRELDAKRLVARQGNRALALAVFRTRPDTPDPDALPHAHALRQTVAA
jgi:ribosomal peptide maturation radical SAM protein 1